MDKKQKRLVTIISIVFLVVVIPLLIFLVRQQQNIRSKAAINGTGAEFLAANGAGLPVGAGGIPETTSTNVMLSLQYVPGSSPAVIPSPSPSPTLTGACSTSIFLFNSFNTIGITNGMSIGRYTIGGSQYEFQSVGSIANFTVTGTSTYRIQLWATSNTSTGQPVKITEGSSAFSGQTSAGANFSTSDLTAAPSYLRLGHGTLECRVVKDTNTVVASQSYTVNVTDN